MYDLPPPPVHPQPGIFETTIVQREGGPVLTHHDIEKIMARPEVTIRDMQEKATASMVLRGWTKNPDGVMVPPRSTLAPKKKPAKKAPPRKKP